MNSSNSKNLAQQPDGNSAPQSAQQPEQQYDQQRGAQVDQQSIVESVEYKAPNGMPAAPKKDGSVNFKQIGGNPISAQNQKEYQSHVKVQPQTQPQTQIQQQPQSQAQPQEKNPKSPAEEVLIRPLRTYADDVKNVISNQNISKTKMFVAEQDRRELELKQRQKEDVHNPKNKFFVVLTIILVLLGAGALSFIFLIYPNLPKENTNPIIATIKTSFISVESQKEIVTENRNILNVFEEIGQTIETPFEKNTIKEILLTKTEEVETESGINDKKVTISTEQLFDLIDSNAPDSLIRSLNKDFFFGVHATNYNDPLLIFQVEDFENAYAGMLEWESSIALDLKKIFSVFNESGLPFPEDQNTEDEPIDTENTTEQTATSSDENVDEGEQAQEQITDETSTNTELVVTENPTDSYNPKLFEDVVLSNRDMRAIFTISGQYVFYYSFIDEKTLLLATSPMTIPEIINRVKTNNLIQKL